MRLPPILGFLPLAVTILTAAAPAPKPAELDRFVSSAGQICLKAPARTCIDRGFAHADTDRSGTLSLAEVTAVQRQVDAWYAANGQKLPPADRQRLNVGLLVVRTVGPGQLFASYDSNADGQLTKAEALADLKLDDRPLPVILGDPNAIDWTKVGARAGSAAPLLRGLLGL